MGQALQTVKPTEEEDPLLAAFGKLSTKQRDLLEVLPECATVKEACEKAGVPERTGRRWLTQPVFKEAYYQCGVLACADVELAQINAAKGKDTLARIHYLKNRHPAYREKPLEIVQRTDGNTVLAATANAIAATELSKAIQLLIGATKATATTELQVLEGHPSCELSPSK